jgi:hypothetical protein
VGALAHVVTLTIPCRMGGSSSAWCFSMHLLLFDSRLPRRRARTEASIVAAHPLRGGLLLLLLLLLLLAFASSDCGMWGTMIASSARSGMENGRRPRRREWTRVGGGRRGGGSHGRS